jgi:long-chain fatty acid transport protein
MKNYLNLKRFHKKCSAALLVLPLSLLALTFPTKSHSSGYGVFTHGASGLGQANAVVAHTTGPSSLYFNPALLNDVPGRQVEIGTTAIYADREVQFDSNGQVVGSDNTWEFPSTLYYTHQANEKITAGIGVYFPFGLSNSWGGTYEGRYLGTEAEMSSININPAVSWRVNSKLSLAAGLDIMRVETDLRAMVNQSVVGTMLPAILGGPVLENLPDVEQVLEGEGWGAGYNLGLLYNVTEKISIGAAYRSEIDVDFDQADVKFNNVDDRLTLLFNDTAAEVEITLPAQFVAGVAFKFTEALIAEIGCRWEDWDSTSELRADLNTPFLTQTQLVIPRNWKSTWAYNIGGQYKLSDTLSLSAGYLYGENPVPDSTFEPVIPDSDAHLFTIGADAKLGQWTVSGAFGYELHKNRDKNNTLGDPLGALAFGQPVNTGNGSYKSELYLVGISIGYMF